MYAYSKETKTMEKDEKVNVIKIRSIFTSSINKSLSKEIEKLRFNNRAIEIIG
jgi:hypothetical protein